MKFQILDGANQIIKQSKDPKRKFKNDLPTHQWFNPFRSLYPDDRVRTPQGVSKISIRNLI